MGTCSIIIMQRRKLPQCSKNRPKLVIQRPLEMVSSQDPIKLGRPISISKLITANKVNWQHQTKVFKRHSLKSLQKNTTPHKKTVQSRASSIDVDRVGGKVGDNLYILETFQQKFDYNAEIEDQAQKMVKKARGSGQEDAFVQNQAEISHTVLKDGDRSQKYGESFKISIKSKGLLEQKLQCKDQNRRNSFSQKKGTVKMAIHNSYKLTFYNRDNQINDADSIPALSRQRQLNIQSSVLSYRIQQEYSKQEDEFVLGHLAECDDYIMAQPNKILHDACRRHKYLQEELFAYADLLSISHLGAQTYVPQVNIQQAENELDRSMRTVNRQLIQGQLPAEEKNRIMRDHILEVRQAYASILQELMSVIDSKTQQARTFVSKMLKWEENYITRKEFLANLKQEYYQALFCIRHTISSLSDVQQARQNRITLEENVAKLNQIYMLGNSFY